MSAIENTIVALFTVRLETSGVFTLGVREVAFGTLERDERGRLTLSGQVGLDDTVGWFGIGFRPSAATVTTWFTSATDGFDNLRFTERLAAPERAILRSATSQEADVLEALTTAASILEIEPLRSASSEESIRPRVLRHMHAALLWEPPAS